MQVKKKKTGLKRCFQGQIHVVRAVLIQNNSQQGLVYSGHLHHKILIVLLHDIRGINHFLHVLNFAIFFKSQKFAKISNNKATVKILSLMMHTKKKKKHLTIL